MLAQGLLQAALPEAPWRELVSSLGYTTGFVFVTMGRQQLFTETTLTVMLPVLHGTHGFRDVGRYWAIVFGANIVATLLFAAAVSIPGLFPPDAVRAFTELGVNGSREMVDGYIRPVEQRMPIPDGVREATAGARS